MSLLPSLALGLLTTILFLLWDSSDADRLDWWDWGPSSRCQVLHIWGNSSWKQGAMGGPLWVVHSLGRCPTKSILFSEGAGTRRSNDVFDFLYNLLSLGQC